MFEIKFYFGNAVENWQRICSSIDNFIWIDRRKVYLLPRKYFSSWVNEFTNGLKILAITKQDFFQLNISQSDQLRLSNYCRADFSSVWGPLTCWLS